jgi:hypothetical protein
MKIDTIIKVIILTLVIALAIFILFSKRDPNEQLLLAVKNNDIKAVRKLVNVH